MKLKDLKVGKWLKEKAPQVLDVVGDVLPSSGALGVVKNVLDGIGDPKLSEEFEAQRLDFEREMFALEVDDRKDARRNTADRHLKIVVAYFSLVGFTAFTIVEFWLAYQILVNKWEVNEFIVMTTAEMHGVFTALLFTLKDYLYGGKSNDTD